MHTQRFIKVKTFLPLHTKFWIGCRSKQSFMHLPSIINIRAILLVIVEIFQYNIITEMTQNIDKPNNYLMWMSWPRIYTCKPVVKTYNLNFGMTCWRSCVDSNKMAWWHEDLKRAQVYARYNSIQFNFIYMPQCAIIR